MHVVFRMEVSPVAMVFPDVVLWIRRNHVFAYCRSPTGDIKAICPFCTNLHGVCSTVPAYPAQS